MRALLIGALAGGIIWTGFLPRLAAAILVGIVLVADDAKRHHFAVAVAGLDGDDPLAAAVLGGVVGGGRPLSVALFAHRQQRGRGLARHHRHAHHLVPLAQADAAHAARRPAHG